MSQAEPWRLHILGEGCHYYPDPEPRRRSTVRKITCAAEVDQAEADVSFLNDGHGKCVTRARDGYCP